MKQGGLYARRKGDPEVWKVIPGFDCWYEASNLGRIKSWRTRARLNTRSKRPRILDRIGRVGGYQKIKLSHPILGKIVIPVHHLILATFCCSRPANKVCDHINAVRDDNRLENLRWISAAENVRHTAELGRIEGRGSRSCSTLTIEDIRQIRELRASGRKLRELADIFKVSDSAISRIALFRSWKEIV